MKDLATLIKTDIQHPRKKTITNTYTSFKYYQESVLKYAVTVPHTRYASKYEGVIQQSS